MGFRNIRLLLIKVIICVVAAAAASRVQAQAGANFKCSGLDSDTCRALVDYQSPNRTTLRAIQALFGVKHMLDILGANGLDGGTPGNHTVEAQQIIRIPFNCRCSNGTGLSNNLPSYTIQKGDTLYHIAAEVFSGLVSYEQIEQVNNITQPTLIQPGQKVWIPLPCSCDKVSGSNVVHYGLLVANGSSLPQIAEKYGTTEDTLLTLNGLSDPNKLQAGQILDVPLKACSSVVRNDSLDFPLLVANGTDSYTANGCVKCKCDSANNWTLQCQPSQLRPYNWSSCPSMQCDSSSHLLIGNSTSTGSCNRTTCAYAGYNTSTIFTTLATDQSTCPAETGKSGAPRSILQRRDWSWNNLFIAIHLILFGACVL